MPPDTIPLPARRILCARGTDAFETFLDAVSDGDRETAHTALRDLAEVFDDWAALAKEHTS